MISLEEQSIEELQTLLDRKQHKRDCCSQKINRLTDVVRRVGVFQTQNHKGETVCNFFDHGASIPQGVTITQRPEAEEDFLNRVQESNLIREATKLKLQRLDSEIKEIGDILRRKNRERDREIQRIQEEEERQQQANIEREERLEFHKILIPREKLEEQIKKEWVYGGISKIEPFDWNEFNQYFHFTSRSAREWAQENFRNIPDPSVIDVENKSLLEKMNTFLFMETNSPTNKGPPYAIILKDDEFRNVNIIKRNSKEWFRAVFNFEVTTTMNVVKFMEARDNPRVKRKPTAPAFKNLFDLWTEWTRGMKVINQVIFDPKLPPGFIQTKEKSVFNEWEGFQSYYDHQYFLRHASVEEYDKVVETFKHHFEDVICRKNEKISDYLIKWMAWVRQNPGEKSEVVPVLIGPQGCGKSMAIQIFCALFGTHGKYVSDYRDIVVRQFNESLMSKKIIIGMDEVKFNDDDTMNALKNLITGSERRTEQKFHEMRQVKNGLNLMMSTNPKERLFHLDAGMNRRFLLIEVDSTYQGVSDYFSALSAMFIDGPDAEKNLRYLDRYLSTLDLSDFQVRNAPVTDVLLNQIIRSLTRVEKWWYDVLDKKQHIQPPTPVTPMNGNPRLVDDTIKTDPDCQTWVQHPVKLKDLWIIFEADSKTKISQVDFNLTMERITGFDPETHPLFPSYQECMKWKNTLGGKSDIVRIRSSSPMSAEEGKLKLTERKNNRKRKRSQLEGTGVFRNFFQNS